MKNIAVIIAGGVGHRMGQDIPKQFIHVYDKPVLLYTLKNFQNHPQIDAIEVVCIDGWHDVVWAYAKQYGIDKLKWVVSGVEPAVITDVIAKCNEYGNGVSSMPYNEQIFVINDEGTTTKYIPRETLRRVVTPQAYKFGKLNWAYHKAFEEKIGIYGSSYTNTMMVELGETLHFAAGSDKNIKLTTKDDLEIFMGYLKRNKETELK